MHEAMHRLQVHALAHIRICIYCIVPYQEWAGWQGGVARALCRHGIHLTVKAKGSRRTQGLNSFSGVVEKHVLGLIDVEIGCSA